MVKSSLVKKNSKPTWKKETLILIDAIEQCIQRPANQEDQKSDYRGKKAHTVKLLVLTNVQLRILFLSNAYHGSGHDYRMLKEEFDPEQGVWFDNVIYG